MQTFVCAESTPQVA
ncbi:hypothetical protein PF005_g31426, partial [Phytophthora fragariae]